MASRQGSAIHREAPFLETPCKRASSILCRPLSLRYATRYARRLSNPSTNCNLHFQIDERRRYWDQISQQESSESCGQFEPGMTARHEFPIASKRRTDSSRCQSARFDTDQPPNSAPNVTVRMALSLGPAVGGRGGGNYVLSAILAAAANRYRSRRPPNNSSGGNA